MKIMFICTGNICRSAMAHWLLKKKVEERNIEKIKIFSSGIYAQNGDVPTYEAITVMGEYDVNMKKHRAANIKNSNIKEMDLILCATENHKTELLDIYPKLKEKIYTMKEFVNLNGNKNIKDPWGFDIETYRSCAGEIDKCLELLLEKLNK